MKAKLVLNTDADAKTLRSYTSRPPLQLTLLLVTVETNLLHESDFKCMTYWFMS